MNLSFSGSFLGNLFGIKLINEDYIFINSEDDDKTLHNYNLVLILSLISRIFSFLWIIITPFNKLDDDINEFEDENQIILPHEINDDNHEESVKYEKLLSPKKIKDVKVTTPLLQSKDNNDNNDHEEDGDLMDGQFHVQVILILKHNWYELFGEIFNLTNLIHWIKTLFGKRENCHRNLLWIMILSLFLIEFVMKLQSNLLVASELIIDEIFYSSINYQFYLLIDSLFCFGSSVISMIIVFVLINLTDLNEIDISIIGVSSIILKNVILGLTVPSNSNPDLIQIFSGYTIGLMSYVPLICLKSKLSQIIDRKEFNKLFSLLALINSVIPILLIVIQEIYFGKLKNYLFYSGLTYHILSIVLLIPICILIEINLFKK